MRFYEYIVRVLCNFVNIIKQTALTLRSSIYRLQNETRKIPLKGDYDILIIQLVRLI